VPEVFATFDGPLGESFGVSSRRIQALCHMTDAGQEVIRRAENRARCAQQRMVAELQLTERQVAFVMALNFDPEGVPDRFAAMRAGYPEQGAADTARKLRATKKIEKAVQMRRAAESTLSLRPHEVYANEVASREGGRDGRRTVKLLAHKAEVEAMELYAEACRRWNAVGGQR
jgi:hypothetical protein